ncbi:hypothetical protein EOI86_16865 [Hwanghaeella grinnelliae]|uniref:PAS domain-containing protein n=1 Tax=Hwanghaeella grinnelliae TaxID=2500179 RepID=A0A3S2Z9P3_9PROT|nr:hypothetical protein [Hwanghaeella grinnelliae]RVU36834.1 hypothetical protein EOI86_16865 [Hwanghaeella grinnelliae]
MVKRLNFQPLSSFTKGRALVDDAMSRRPPRTIDLDEALDVAGMRDHHRKLMESAVDGVIEWDRFDIIDFGPIMPSIALLDSVTDEDGNQDFKYGYVGESINEIAQRPLRGLKLGDVLVGEAKEKIISEYAAALNGGHPRVSVGRVTISDLDWVQYMRFLYPVRRDGEVNRILLIMLFSL